MGTENLEKIFNPRRIAVIGASDREGSVGAKLFRNLIGVGYNGAVYPVNPFRTTIQGITAYPSILKIPWRVDLAIIATPAHIVPQIIEECGKAGVSGIIIISAGFREAGKEGEALEEQIVEAKNNFNMRIIGPNCFGVIRPRLKLNATFANKSAIPGKIAFISQSAALCASVLDWAAEANIGFSVVVSTGSMLDVDLGDLIDYFGADAQTRSIVLYVESIKNARKFMSATRGFARAKPIVVVKAGRFTESAEATISHTGALCGEDAVYDAAFRRAGAIRVEAINDLFNCAEALAMQPNPKGPNLTIITNAGGPGIMATDLLIARGGRLSQLSDETIQALKSLLPSYCSMINPIDILEEATPERFKKVIEISLKDSNSDGFLIIYTPQGAADPLTTAEIILELSKQTTKPILTSLMGEDDCRRARQILRKNKIPAFTTPEQAVSTFMHMYSYTQNLELLYQIPEELPVELSIPTFLKEVLRRAFNEKRTVLNQLESLQFLEAYKIPTVRTLLAKSSEEAELITSELGYPIVMKALSPQITHKSKAEGVILNVWSQEQVKTFFDKLAKRVKNYSPEAEFQGVVIQPMVQKRGYELLIGLKKDPQFGPVIVFGLGGVITELLKDTYVGFPPLNQVLARRLVEKVVHEHLESSVYPPNIKLLEEILVKFSQLVIDFPEIKEMDVNPIIVDEKDAVAVDARIILDTEKILQKHLPHEHLVIAPYPRKYITQWTLRDGTSVVLRPIKPEDEALLNELFKSLSEETMRFRFFQVIKDMSHETLTRYCNLDYDREVAIVAEIQKDERKIVGVGRLILEPGGKRGEFAVVVGDQWQGLGLGTKLMDYIIEISKDMDLKTIYGYVISNNIKMVNLCAKKGFKMEPTDEELSKATLDIS
ncbi:MAG: bifunctional acetate--CoA ligase family protein/GNAT family N-acetyltransferase [Candidatus Bathyarchaeota archaeon]|nr:bifunctional acetate--CoA ligase family protein/GNAT family N-acetyltransferase [Candidatus Bathyarchaeota archaeon]MDH5787083.1 bifunctional acetate--CoA ligase family protein/GNAT family N-acetyltransferase [Candidatus Bathyarchaeota archaeon]